MIVIMKKLLLIIASIGTLATFSFQMNAQSPNPIVKRLSAYEIARCATPEAVAYNFIESILCRDFYRMLSYADAEFTRNIMAEVNDNNLTYDLFFIKYFSKSGGEKLDILGWIPALARDYEVAIAYVQDEWYYEKDGSLYSSFNQTVIDGMIYIPGEPKPYVGINEKKVYVTCSPTSEINHSGFQNITRYGDSNVKVLLTEVGGKWKVIGFD